MLYSNQYLHVLEKNLPFGTIYQVAMGQIGPCRKFMALTCPKATKIRAGMNLNYTIGTTRRGHPRINKMHDGTLYMMLSAEISAAMLYANGKHTIGMGSIEILRSQQDLFEVLARGNGANDSYYWDCFLLKAPTAGIVRVHYYTTEDDSDLYLIHESNVYHCHLAELEECCKNLGIDVPCELAVNGKAIEFGNDWVTL